MFLRKHFIAKPEPMKSPAALELEDILLNLRAMFVARRGCSSFRENYGLSTTGYGTVQTMVSEISLQIRENVGLYERRLEILRCDEAFDDDTQEAMVLAHCRVLTSGVSLFVICNPRRTEIHVGEKPRNVS